jgi:ribosomal-protein-serine acetyltransferase
MATCPTAVNTDVELFGRHVVLRPLTEAHESVLYDAVRESIAEVGRWLPWCHSEYRLQETCEHLASRTSAWIAGTEYSFGVFKQTDDRFLGGVGINFIDWVARRGNLGYWIRTSAAGCGYASDAARTLGHWGVTGLGLQRLEIVAAVENVGSQRAAEKAGAKREGVLRNRCRISDAPQDAVVFSFVPEDFSGVPAKVGGG